jgi:hypothetical protein
MPLFPPVPKFAGAKHGAPAEPRKSRVDSSTRAVRVAGAFGRIRDAQPNQIYIGEYRLRQFGLGKIWLDHKDGEGMETSEAKLQEHIKAYFHREM